MHIVDNVVIATKIQQSQSNLTRSTTTVCPLKDDRRRKAAAYTTMATAATRKELVDRRNLLIV